MKSKFSPNSQNISAKLREAPVPALRRAQPASGADRATPPLNRPTIANSDPGLQSILLPAARSRWMLPTAASMTPPAIANILAEALVGKSPRREHELYQLMEMTWPRLAKNTSELKNAVLGLEWNVMDSEDAPMPGMAALLKRTKNGMRGDPTTGAMGWRAMCESLLDAWFYGVAVCELVWETRGAAALPLAMLPKNALEIPPWHFGWRTGPAGHNSAGALSQGEPGGENDGRLVLYPDANSQQAAEFAKDKYLIGIRRARRGHPSGGALLRALAWWWCAANFTSEWLLNFAQIFGQPLRWGTYPLGNDAAQKALASMLENMGSAAWGAGPEGSKVEFIEAKNSGSGNSNPQERVLDRADTACDLLVLGQTLTTSQGERGSQALGEVHAQVRGDVIDAAAAWLAEVLNEQLVPSIANLNYGDPGEEGRLPYYEPTKKMVRDQKVLAETIRILKEAGLKIPVEWIYEALDIPRPEEGDEILGGDAVASEPPAPVAFGSRARMAAVLAKLPTDTRAYLLAKMEEAQAS